MKLRKRGKTFSRMRQWALKRLESEWSPMVELCAPHDKCCKVVALKAIKMAPWHSAAFNVVLDSAYGESDKLGCELYGFKRRFMIYFFVFLAIDWSK